MNPRKILHWLHHYIYGLLTSCWQAGITAVKINGGITLAAAAAPQLLHTPDLRAMIGIFGAAAIWEAIEYFDANRVPPTLEDFYREKKLPPPGSVVEAFAGRTSSDLYQSIAGVEAAARDMLAAADAAKKEPATAEAGAALETYATRILVATAPPHA